MKPILKLWVISTIVTISKGGHENMTDSQRLVDDILGKYDHRVRPVKNFSKPVNVTMRLNLYQILDVNERNQNIALSMWVTQMWDDEFLVWDPDDYGGLDTIIVPWNQIWLPDTYLYNSLVMSREESERWINVVVTTDGNVGKLRFMYPSIFTFSCKLNIRYFPFDTQNCTLILASWTSDKSAIDYNPENETIPTENYITNEEWNMLSFNMYRHENFYECCPNPWVTLRCHLVIQRKALFYLVNLIIPTTIIAIVATIGFFTPSTSSGERTEKVNLGITTLLAMAILLLMISDSMPTTSSFVPLIGWFLLGIIVLCSAGTLMTSVVISVHRRGLYGFPVSWTVKKILMSSFPKLIAMAAPMGLVQLWKEEQIEKPTNHINKNDHELNNCELNNDRIEVTPFVQTLTSVNDELMIEKEKEDIHNRIVLEWEYLANVLDRVFLIVFLGSVLLMFTFVVSFGMLRY